MMNQTTFHHAGRQVFPDGPSNDDFRTPADLFETMNQEWDFTLDAAASYENTLCEAFFSEDIDALSKHWVGRVWCNPPYRLTGDFINKAADEARSGTMTWLLVPARTSTKWFRRVWDDAKEIRFISGRLNFSGPHSIEDGKASAPFPSVLIRFGGPEPITRFSLVDRQGHPIKRTSQTGLPLGVDE